MQVQKVISFFDEKMPISVVYTNLNFKSGDTEVEIYSNYKISILLTDGISAISGDT